MLSSYLLHGLQIGSSAYQILYAVFVSHILTTCQAYRNFYNSIILTTRNNLFVTKILVMYASVYRIVGLCVHSLDPSIDRSIQIDISIYIRKIFID
jgi:hypothetical protein